MSSLSFILFSVAKKMLSVEKALWLLFISIFWVKSEKRCVIMTLFMKLRSPSFFPLKSLVFNHNVILFFLRSVFKSRKNVLPMCLVSLAVKSVFHGDFSVCVDYMQYIPELL